jgi:hypothetical protein
MIHESAQYVSPKDNKEWLQLQVINMWDFTTKPVAYRAVQSLGRDELISYCLNKYTAVDDTRSKVEPVKTLTEDMKSELKNRGYTVK